MGILHRFYCIIMTIIIICNEFKAILNNLFVSNEDDSDLVFYNREKFIPNA